MRQEQLPPLTAVDLDFKAAIEADTEVEMKRLGFDDRFGSKALHDNKTTQMVLTFRGDICDEFGHAEC